MPPTGGLRDMGVERDKTIDSLIDNTPLYISEDAKKALRSGVDYLVPHTWQEIKDIIAAGNMGALKRNPIDTRNYIAWHSQVSEQYGGVAEFVRQKRLFWNEHTAVKPEILLNHSDDYKILRNDWPYAFPPEVCHLVVWSKVKIQVDSETGLPDVGSTMLIEEFVDRVFGEGLKCRRNEDNLLWFKQKSLFQSVRALEHIHVLIRGADEAAVTELTGQKRSEITSQIVSSSQKGDFGR
ncbi:hypothetical protein F5Y12DRAFT_736476 [Xylaria sp. FL1777]|nr:hypothetical protein F5Y12DRAFT_736476 [Xylaria sp. FL1777]